MIGFDFVFALFSLVLGLAVAEVLGGLAKALKLHAAARAGKARDVRIGWLTPLLAILVTLNQLSFWMFAFNVRETLPFSFLTLLAVLVVVGLYYLFSALVFPDDPAEWPDFDDWYDLHNRLILGGMTAINFAIQMTLPNFMSAARAAQLEQLEASDDWRLTLTVVFAVLYLLIMPVLIWVRGRRANRVLLIVLIALNLAAPIAFTAAGYLPV